MHRRLLVLSSIASLVVASSTIPSSAKILNRTPFSDDEKLRISYISDKLCDRLDHVLEGKRILDFRDFIQSQGGQPRIFSMHGIDVNFESTELQRMGHHNSYFPNPRRSATRQRDPFPSNRYNLQFSKSNHTSSLYHPREVEESGNLKPPTPLQLLLRAMRLFVIFAPVLMTAWIAVLSPQFRSDIWYKWLAQCLGSCGAAFIKWGQWAATRADMFPPALCDALSKLHEDAPSHSWEFTQAQVEASLDIPSNSLDQVFESFDKLPLASGSIAQVHKARLFNGMDVAVKVRHPQVAQLVEMDFRLMEMIATVADALFLRVWKGPSVKSSIMQFHHTMAAQAHLNLEAHHLEVLNHNFRNWKQVQFPRPIFASSALIVETFEPGKIVSKYLDSFDATSKYMGSSASEGNTLIPLDEAKFIVTTGVSVYLKMLLLDNVMHADLHPGNILLHGFRQSPNELPGNLQMTLVDAGMIAQLTDEESSTFIGLLTSIGDGNGAAAAEFTLQFSKGNNISSEERECFKNEMSSLFAERCRGYGTNVDVGNVLRGVLGLIRDHRIRIDANYATLVVNVLCIESLSRRICPSYNVLDAARPLLQTYRCVAYQADGYTPRRNAKSIKKLIPIILYGKKRISDDAFFARIATSQQKKGY